MYGVQVMTMMDGSNPAIRHPYSTILQVCVKRVCIHHHLDEAHKVEAVGAASW